VRRRWVAWGLGLACVYLAAAVWLWGLTELGRVLYDGVAPLPPYRWVHPPVVLAPDNRPPSPGRGTLAFTTSGSAFGSVVTGDGQCAVILKEGAVAPQPGDFVVLITITPIDPQAVSEPPPGVRFDGNACRIEAVYERSRQPVRLRGTVAVVLRYATGATQVVQAASGGWMPLRTVRYAGRLQLVVTDDTPTLGTFAAVAPKDTPYVHRTPWTQYAVGLGLAALAVLLLGFSPRLLARWRARRGKR